MRIIVLFAVLFVYLTKAALDISSIVEDQLPGLFKKDWESLLPSDVKNVRSKLIDLLKPAAPAPPAPASSHLKVSRMHNRHQLHSKSQHF